MKFLFPLTLGLCLTALPLSSSAARDDAALHPAGVIGNSGVEGEHLIRTETWPGPARANANNSATLDAAGTLWFFSGSGFLRTTLDGRLLATVPLGDACKGMAGTTFARVGSQLFFIGRSEKGPALFALDTDAQSAPSLVWEPDEAFLPQERFAIAPELGKDGRLLYVTSRFSGTPEDSPIKVTLGWLDPAGGGIEELHQFEAQTKRGGPTGLTYNPANGHFYLGGYFGKVVSSDKFSPQRNEIIEFSPTGEEVRRRDMLPLPAVPSRFAGAVNRVGNSLWDAAGYGFTGRLGADLRADPGIITTWDQAISQIAHFSPVRPQGAPVDEQAARFEPMLIAMRPWGSVYFARYDKEEQALSLETRIGSMPQARHLAMNRNGWVSVATQSNLQLWWRWEDGPASPPRFGTVNVSAFSSGGFSGDRLSTLTEQDGYRRPETPITYRSATFWPTAGRTNGRRNGKGLPTNKPGGYTVEPNGKRAWLSDADSGALYHSPMQPHRWEPGEKWTFVEMDGTTLEAPGEIAVLAGGIIAVAEPGALVFLREEKGGSVTFIRRISHWGNAPEDRLGQKLRIAGNGAQQVLVSDTERHRVLLFDPDAPAPLAQVGTTDTPGTAVNEFDTPAAIAAAGERAVVYDSGNQRLIKLVLSKP